MIGGGVLAEVAISLLPFVGYGSETLWETPLLTRLPLIVTLVCAAAIGLAAASLLTNEMIPLVLATCCSFWLLGQIYPVGHPTTSTLVAGSGSRPARPA